MVLVNKRPKALVYIEDQSIMEDLDKFSYSLEIIDNAGYINDSLTITVFDNLDRLVKPNLKKKFTISLGYEDVSTDRLPGVEIRHMGTFEVAEVVVKRTKGEGRMMIVTATGVNYQLKGLTSKRSMAWQNQTLQEIVNIIGKSSGLSFQLSDDLASQVIPYIYQDEEDQQFLSKLALRYDALYKVYDKTIYFQSRGITQGLTNGTEIAPTILYGELANPYDCTILDIEHKESKYFAYNTVEADYKISSADTKDSIKTYKTGVGDDDHTLKLPLVYDNYAVAKQIADTKFKQLKRLNKTIVATIIGNPLIASGQYVDIQECDREIDGKYFVDEVTHIYDADNGYDTKLNLSLAEDPA